MSETRKILVLSKATLDTGGLEALRVWSNAAQSQKILAPKKLPSIELRRCSSRRGRAESPAIDLSALPVSQWLRNLVSSGVNQSAHKKEDTNGNQCPIANPENPLIQNAAIVLPGSAQNVFFRTLMGKQYNKVIKRARRKAYKSRKKVAIAEAKAAKK